MELTRFADETRRLQSELKPTPPWSWVAAQMAGALAGFESGGLTDAILLTDLQREWQGGRAAAVADEVRKVLADGRVERDKPLSVDVQSLDGAKQLIWLTAPGAAGQAPAMPHIPHERLMRMCREGAVGPRRRLRLIGCAVAEVAGSIHLLPTKTFALVLDADQPGAPDER